jgi:NTE family protein
MATRALVLDGGGFVGVAWESGLLAGLSESGVDLARADLIVCTSAGSFVGAQVAMGRSAQPRSSTRYLPRIRRGSSLPVAGR